MRLIFIFFLTARLTHTDTALLHLLYVPLYNPPSEQFPVSSPYVLAVGATQGPESNNPEVSCSSSTGNRNATDGMSNIYSK